MTPYYETKLGKLYYGECEDIIPLLTDNSITLLLTDPPYVLDNRPPGKSNLRSFDKYSKEKYVEITNGFDVNALYSLITPKFVKGMNSFTFCSNKQITSIMGYGENLNYQTTLLVWHKRNATPFCHNVWRPNLEYIVHMREYGTVFNDCNTQIKTKCYSSNTVKNDIHPTVKPIDMIENFIKIGSNENDIVLDPYAGSGTTAIAAEKLNRKWICIEKKKEYCDYIIKQLNTQNINDYF